MLQPPQNTTAATIETGSTEAARKVAPLGAKRRKRRLSPKFTKSLEIAGGVAALSLAVAMASWSWNDNKDWRACTAQGGSAKMRVEICDAVIQARKQSGVYLAAAYRARAGAEAERQNVVEALQDLDTAIALAPKTPSHWLARCRLRADNAIDLDLALEDCAVALALRPNWEAASDAKALTLLKLERFDQARRAFDMGGQSGPSVAWRQYGRGLAKQALGDGAGGQADMAAALQREPAIAKSFADAGFAP